MKLTSIISVNFNQPEVTLAFLRSVKNNTTGIPVELILVDNGSREDHEAEFTAAYPDLKYLRSEQNLGFAGGNNIGIKIATGEFLLLLNNDTEISPNLITVLTETMNNHPEIGIISPLILYYDQPDTIQYAGFTEMNYLTARNMGIGNMEHNQGQYDQDSRETGFCHGAAMMCRRSDLDKTGLMAENYFLYYEELDWCEQFKRAGKKIWFTGQTKIYHKESMSVGKESSIKTYFMTRNRMLFIRRNTGLLNTLLFSCFYIGIACPKQIFTYLKKGRTDLVKWVFKGVLWNFSQSKTSKYLGFKI
ncbi:glycosyltransferase family 2 protein [Pedobacter sp. PLR]|uniref:glycosyltransferase family 2 protein n=1 Tax=Pedobacter sp. PLR TaxID=2994465 RepID=UPI002246D430|nr:glycosyltransferase family 2 protein [Pedobacter sp. PLR]MCX2449845.1 glycosyltransferase family 2 protein [Pedobacter sp. PLR]